LASEEWRSRLDPGDGIPADPSEQLLYLRSTNNGWHSLDPPEDEQPDQSLPHLTLGTSSIQQQFLTLCRTDLGYTEDSRGRSKFGIWYGDRPDVHNSAFDSAPWCDMFLARKAVDLLGDAEAKRVGLYALTTAHARYLHGKGVTSRPATFPTGAFAFQNWDLDGTGNGNLDKIDHVEVVEEDHGDGTATFVGGNVDNGVRRRHRAKGYCVVIAEWWKLLDLISVPAADDWYAVPGSRS
jgi:hypothetical protein